MMNIKKLFLHILTGIFLFSSSVSVYAECLVFPPVCPVEMCGYQTQESPTQQMVQKVITGYKETRAVVKAAMRLQQQVMTLATTAVATVSKAIVAVVSWPFQQIGNMLGLTKSAAEDDTQSITQDNTHGDISVDQRLTRDLKTFNSEPNTDYKWQKFNKNRRAFIRQQSTISLMAYALVLKSHFADIKEIMDNVEQAIQNTVEESSKKEPNDTYNEAVLVQQNYYLREAWFKLLSIQKLVEAVKLEFTANQSIAGMQMIKIVPNITSSNTEGSSK